VVAALIVVCVVAWGLSMRSNTSQRSAFVPVETVVGQTSGRASVEIDGVIWDVVSIDGRPVGDLLHGWFRISNKPPPNWRGNSSDSHGVYLDGSDGCNDYGRRGDLRAGRLSMSDGGFETLVGCSRPLVRFPPESSLQISGEWLLVEGIPILVAFDRAAGRPSTEPPVVPERGSVPPSEPLSTVAIGTAQPMPDGFAALVGSRWILTEVQGEPWSSSLTPSFTIGSGVGFSGHDGRNRFVGNWWLDGDALLVRADEPTQLPCRAVVPKQLRPAGGFRFQLAGEVFRSGSLGSGVVLEVGGSVTGSTQLVPIPETTTVEGDPVPVVEQSAEPYVVFERQYLGVAIVDESQLVGNWRTADGIAVTFTTDSELVVGDCGPVARWTFTEQLTITRVWESYRHCDVLADSTSFAMLLLDSRSPETLEILDDGTLLHISDSALTLLKPE
jgi:hypothetical protein